MTNCCPERRTISLPNLPTTIPLGEFLSRPALARSDFWAKRDSPWRERCLVRRSGISTASQMPSGTMKPMAVASLIFQA
jgi:hypothetical protein